MTNQNEEAPIQVAENEKEYKHRERCNEFKNACLLNQTEPICICWQVDIVNRYRKHNKSKKANKMRKFKEYFKGVRYER